IYVSQNPLIVNSVDSVIINVLIDDNYGIDYVSFWYDDSNYTMTKVELNWTFTISPRPDGTEINYRIYTQDWAGNWAVSDTFTYIVGSNTSVTITSITTTTDPFIPSELFESLPTILLASGILLVVVIVIYSKRRRMS
ncbi:MAG: hypothetical protein KAR03_12035, partial [Candidatus Thorarchaeota archaeon]|nr:hypothetical protein [Candidatus Thorarchaeota archaeon]